MIRNKQGSLINPKILFLLLGIFLVWFFLFRAEPTTATTVPQTTIINQVEETESLDCRQVCLNEGVGYLDGYVGTSVNHCVNNEDTALISDGFDGICCCISPEVEGYTCEDSDGINMFVSGWCQDSYNQLGFVDSCSSYYVVSEYFCNPINVCEQMLVPCNPPQHCSDGRCV